MGTQGGMFSISFIKITRRKLKRGNKAYAMGYNGVYDGVRMMAYAMAYNGVRDGE